MKTSSYILRIINFLVKKKKGGWLIYRIASFEVKVFFIFTFDNFLFDLYLFFYVIENAFVYSNMIK
jgi:hypothetical protein